MLLHFKWQAFGRDLFLFQVFMYLFFLVCNTAFAWLHVTAIQRELPVLSGDPVVIIAGYEAEMQSFLQANAGLARRFDHTLSFPDCASPGTRTPRSIAAATLYKGQGSRPW